MDELAEAAVGLFPFKESMDTSTAHGRATPEMAAVFARLEREMTCERGPKAFQSGTNSPLPKGVVINLKAAQALGLTIPDSLLARAVHNTLNAGRHLISASTHRQLRATAFTTWRDAVGIAA